jgi:protein-tyrosine-phosphatase
VDLVVLQVVVAMNELGIDVSGRQPQKLTQELAEGASLLVTMVRKGREGEQRLGPLYHDAHDTTERCHLEVPAT